MAMALDKLFGVEDKKQKGSGKKKDDDDDKTPISEIWALFSDMGALKYVKYGRKNSLYCPYPVFWGFPYWQLPMGVPCMLQTHLSRAHAKGGTWVFRDVREAEAAHKPGTPLGTKVLLIVNRTF